MKKNIQLILLFIIIILAFFFYTFKLAEVPSGLYVDEAVVGYNAYSIMHTGRDEYGAFLPVAFRFFGSYTPPLNTYLLVPIITFLDLSIFSTRLLSVLCGLLMILVIFAFLKKLEFTKNIWIPIIGTLVFAITPYTFFYARIGYETFLGLTVFSLGALLAFLSLNNKNFIVPSFLLLSLSTYTTHAQKYLIPIFVIGYIIIFRKKIFKKEFFKHIATGLTLGLLMQIPNLSFILSPAFLIKSDLFYIQPIQKTAQYLSNFFPEPLAYIMATIREFSSQYLTYFSPRSLFFTPDPDLQRSLPDMSTFYPWMVIPYFLGLFSLWKKRGTLAGKFILLLLLISPVPAAITGDPFSTQRALTILLPLSIVIILGIDMIINNLKAKIWIPLGLVVIFFSLLFLWRSYFILLPLERSEAWSFGFSQLAEHIKKNPQNNYIIDQYQIKPAYIELAFFLKYPPDKFQDELIDKSIEDNYYTNTKWCHHYKFGNITTRLIDFEKDLCQGNILVGDKATFSPDDIEKYNLEQVIDIKDPLGNIVLVGYKVLDNLNCKSS